MFFALGFAAEGAADTGCKLLASEAITHGSDSESLEVLPVSVSLMTDHQLTMFGFPCLGAVVGSAVFVGGDTCSNRVGALDGV